MRYGILKTVIKSLLSIRGNKNEYRKRVRRIRSSSLRTRQPPQSILLGRIRSRRNRFDRTLKIVYNKFTYLYLLLGIINYYDY